jgi:demethylmenaquinone methyltransferase/2-methoxy-6-polyprenyl-1,4-benzoquinol methylase
LHSNGQANSLQGDVRLSPEPPAEETPDQYRYEPADPVPIASEKVTEKPDAVLPEAAEKAAVVREMFDRIAPRYDALNRLISLSLDQRWRRLALQDAEVGTGDQVIDLACGTGDLSALAVEMGAQVVGVDFSGRMLAGARQRQITADWIQADASLLPFPSAWATVVVSGFALRNFVSIPVVFAESARVLKVGGRLVLIEVDTPHNPFVRTGHALYFNRIVPLLGALLSDAKAYAYLPRSVSYLPNSQELQNMIEVAGFGQVRKQRLFGGVAQIVSAVRM